VGAHVIKRSSLARADQKRRNEQRTLAGLLVAIIVTLSLVYLLVSADLRQDLSEANPRSGAEVDGAPIFGWRPLAVEIPAEAQTLRQHGPADGTSVSMLGYMMDGCRVVRKGAQVTEFTLMPDAGSWVHAAHRDPDEMVEVRLMSGTRVPYMDRRLVWVTGRFHHIRSVMRYGEALYRIDGARVREASAKALAQWFSP